MARRSAKRPTDGELTILRVLWEHGPCTVRQVNRILNETRPTGYTTTLKQMQVMTDKRLLAKDESRRPQVYRSAQSPSRMRKQLAEHLVDKVFGGSAQKLVMQVLESRDISPKQLAQIEKLLGELEEE
ncbi:MAG: transcriptional regulator [Planctomycetaceae bacterium]|nr:transcriptional regulator [Planctomycetaceae bacterium]